MHEKTPGVNYISSENRLGKDEPMKTLLLNREQIRELITIKDTVEIVEKTFAGFGEGTVVNPTKVNLDLGEINKWPSYRGFMNAMPAYVGWLDSAGLKWVGGFQDNKESGLPYLTGMILLIDPHSGQFRCVADGALITNLRTGAQTAVALKYLHPKSSIRLGLYGAGAQGYTQIQAIAEVLEIDELRIYDIDPDASKRLSRDMESVVAGKILEVQSPEEAADADAIISVTQSKEKFIKDEWVKEGTIVFPMGSYQECEDDIIFKADKIIVDHVDQALHRGALRVLAAQQKIQENHITTTIGEVVSSKHPGRTSESERILCIPVGTGAMDVAVATVAYQRAIEKGIGQSFSFV
jgi:alanine dehydrogenase